MNLRFTLGLMTMVSAGTVVRQKIQTICDGWLTATRPNPLTHPQEESNHANLSPMAAEPLALAQTEGEAKSETYKTYN